MSYDPSTTAILLVDPYNDFLSEGGKLWPRVKAVAQEVELLDHLREVVSTARARELKIFFALADFFIAKLGAAEWSAEAVMGWRQPNHRRK